MVHRDHDSCLMFPCNLHPGDALETLSDDAIAAVAVADTLGERHCCTNEGRCCMKHSLGTAHIHRCHGKTDCRIEVVQADNDAMSQEGVVLVAMAAGNHLEAVAGCIQVVVELFEVDCRVSPGHRQDRWRCSFRDHWRVGSDHLGERILLEGGRC